MGGVSGEHTLGSQCFTTDDMGAPIPIMDHLLPLSSLGLHLLGVGRDFAFMFSNLVTSEGRHLEIQY